MDKKIALNPNAVVAALRKSPETFTREDIVNFVVEHGIKMIDFMYPAEDGRVKTLNFVINDLEYLETILLEGERVDGSSLFPSFVQPGSSDLYVVPRYRTAFVDPFQEIPTLVMLCSFFDKDGQPFECDPAQTLARAEEAFFAATGFTFEAMAELEYYVIAPDEPLYPGIEQKGYHETEPFAKFNDFRRKCMELIAQTGGHIKYGHSEVGTFTLDGKLYEQNEIEFLPDPVDTAADQILLAKWVIRNLAYQWSLEVTFAPKIIVGEAGSGMHIHMRIMNDGRNCMTEGGEISDVARRAIAGMMVLAPSITAFGNKNPTSFFRLVPHQEAPTNVCWGDCNRSALVRVPLGWRGSRSLAALANPLEADAAVESLKQTVEMRSPDGSADIYQLMAALCVACRYGLELDPKTALALADEKYVALDIHKEEGAKVLAGLEALPASCAASADCLEKVRQIYESCGVFSPRMIDGVLSTLRSFGDADLHSRVDSDPTLMKEYVDKYFYCG